MPPGCWRTGKTVAVGTGVPCAAAMLAQKTHAPNLVICFEAGGVAPQLPTMPISVGDSRTIHRAVMATSMADVMQFCQRGMMDYTFLSGAQIDPYGNLNSTLIGGTYHKPKVRLPGSGGASDLASFCWRTLIIMRHDPKKFVEKLDFLTTPGYLTGPGAREAAGLPTGTGPHRVITELAVLDFHPDDETDAGPQPASGRIAGTSPRGHGISARRVGRRCPNRSPDRRGIVPAPRGGGSGRIRLAARRVTRRPARSFHPGDNPIDQPGKRRLPFREIAGNIPESFALPRAGWIQSPVRRVGESRMIFPEHTDALSGPADATINFRVGLCRRVAVPVRGEATIPHVLGRFRVLGEIARGGMGVVLRDDADLDRELAVKLLSPTFCPTRRPAGGSPRRPASPASSTTRASSPCTRPGPCRTGGPTSPCRSSRAAPSLRS